MDIDFGWLAVSLLLHTNTTFPRAFFASSYETRRHRRHPLHRVRGPPLAQRVLRVLQLPRVHGGQGIHHRGRGHTLSGLRKEEAHGRRSGAVRKTRTRRHARKIT